MKVCKIKDIGIIGTGTTPSMKNKEFYDSDDIMFIKPSDFIDNRITELSSSISYISNKSREKARIFPAGTVLCTCIGNIGKIAIVSKEASCNQQNNYIIPYKEFDSKYVAYSLLSQRKKMESIGANAPIVPIINKTEFSNIEIPVYDSSTQIKIAHHLDTIQSAIDNKQQQLKELDELVKSRFIEMFGENPVESGKWHVDKLDNICTEKSGEYGAASASVHFDKNRPRYVRITDINEDGSLNDDFVSSININDDITYKLRFGDFLFARMGATVGKTYAYLTGNQIFAGYLIRFKLNLSLLHPVFLFYYTKMSSYKKWVEENQSGAAQPGINAKRYGKLPIPVPPLSLQNEFAAFVQQIDKSKFVVKQQIKDLQELMDSKMQEYFGG